MKTSRKNTNSAKTKVNRKHIRPKVTLAQKLDMLNPNAAGIDIASEEHWVCVPEDRAENHVRRFGAFTRDLYAIADWLKACEVTTVAMESTSIYWIPLFQVLEDRGFNVCLVNARELKNVSGRPKTDRLDCQWIQRLHSYGLLSASFRPEDEICQLRSLLRHRDTVIRQSAQHIQHMQKALHQMNLLLDKVISDITGVTGLKIIRAILHGERNPMTLAQYRDDRIKSTEEDIAKALEGDYRSEHLFVLKQAFHAYHFSKKQIQQCDREIETLLAKMDKPVATTPEPLPPATSSHKKPQRNEPTYDARSYLYALLGVDVTQVPGLQAATVLTLVAETGRDLTKWPTDKQFTAWLGNAPNKKVSGGKERANRTRKVQSRAALAFRRAAMAASTSKSYLGAFYRRLRARVGPSKALTATARKLAVIYYHMVKDSKPYRELGEEYYLKQHEKRHLKKLKAQAKLLGFDLVPQAS
jgi:transposase